MNLLDIQSASTSEDKPMRNGVLLVDGKKRVRWCLYISEDHLHRYINELAGRHNVRSMDTIDMMDQVAENMMGQRLTYQALISHI